MAFRMTRYLDISAEQALREIQSLDGLWRDPHPAARALTSTSVRVRGDSFHISVGGLDSRGEIFPEVQGSVSATGESTSTLTARVGRPPTSGAWIWLGYGGVAAYLAWTGSLGLAFFIGLAGAATYAQVAGTDRAITYEGSPVSRLLADQIDAVLAPHLSASQSERPAPVA